MGSNGSFKCCIFFMAIFILVQGCVYLGLSVWGIMLTKCSKATTNLASDPIKLAFELVYFKSKECFNTTIQTNLTNQPFELKIDWDISNEITKRTSNILISYAVVSSIWILTSLLVVSSLCAPTNRIVSAICFWPWFLAVFAGSTLDVTATVYHVNDLLHTMQVSNTLNYTGIQGDKFNDIFRPYGLLLMTPALIFTCITSRGILIWLFNIIGFCTCVSLYRRTTPKITSTKHHKNSNRKSISKKISNGRQIQQDSSTNGKRQQQIQADKSLYTQKTDASVSHHKQAIVATEKQAGSETADDVIISASRNNRNGEQTAQDIYTIDKWQQLIQPIKSFQLQKPLLNTEKQISTEAADDIITTRSSQLKRITPKFNADYNSSNGILDTTAMDIQSHEQINHSNIFSNAAANTRYITPHEHYPSYSLNVHINQQLRGQLPWSYLQQPGETPRVSIYPDIPAPDY